MPKALGIAEQRLGVGEEVVPQSDRLCTLKVGVTGHDPAGVAVGLRAKSLDYCRDLGRQLAGGRTAVEAEVKRDLVVARPARVQCGTSRSNLGQPPLDRRVDVLVRVEKRKLAGLKLFVDAAQSSLDGCQLCGRDDAGRGEPARVRDAAGDVKRVELEIRIERR